MELVDYHVPPYIAVLFSDVQSQDLVFAIHELKEKETQERHKLSRKFASFWRGFLNRTQK
jgi:hypothetical protein